MPPLTPPPPDSASSSPSRPGQTVSEHGIATPDPANSAPAPAEPTEWDIYSDQSYGFRIAYPRSSAIKHLDEAARTQLSPAPLAAIQFQQQAADAPPHLTVHIFDNSAKQPLEDWLAAAGLLKNGEVVEPYQGKGVAGIRVSSQSFMAPGTSIYVAHEALVFQLTPLGPAADQMLESFSLPQ